MIVECGQRSRQRQFCLTSEIFAQVRWPKKFAKRVECILVQRVISTIQRVIAWFQHRESSISAALPTFTPSKPSLGTTTTHDKPGNDEISVSQKFLDLCSQKKVSRTLLCWHWTIVYIQEDMPVRFRTSAWTIIRHNSDSDSCHFLCDTSTWGKTSLQQEELWIQIQTLHTCALVHLTSPATKLPFRSLLFQFDGCIGCKHDSQRHAPCSNPNKDFFILHFRQKKIYLLGNLSVRRKTKTPPWDHWRRDIAVLLLCSSVSLLFCGLENTLWPQSCHNLVWFGICVFSFKIKKQNKLKVFWTTVGCCFRILQESAGP